MPGKNKSGEKLIESVLTSHKIRYDRKKKMKLKKDTKAYRIPDFYLPDYNMIIEFFGSWNAPENKKYQDRERKRFMEKVGVYHQNKIHTLYLYPKQLKDAEKLIIKATKQISNLPAIYRQPLYWNIPWLVEKKIEKPKASDFLKSKSVTKETEKIVNEINLEKNNETKTEEKVVVVEKEHKVLVRNAPTTEFKDDYKPISNTFATLLLMLTGLVVFLFLVYGVTVFAGMIELMEPAFNLFILVTIILVILSAIYALERNIFHGFIIVGIILTILILIGILLLGDNVWRLVTTIIIILAIVPTEYYMITSNSK